MDALDAKYPFFATAREAVADAAVSLPELVAADAPAVERARERVERALMDGTVASESAPSPPSRPTTRRPSCSRIRSHGSSSRCLTPTPIEKYAAAEAATAIDRIREDLATDDELRSMSTPTVALDDVLAEFDLADAVRPESLRSDPGTGGTTATGSAPPPGRDPNNTTGSPWDRIFGSRRPRGVSRGGSSTARSTTARCASPVRSFWMRSKPRSKIGSERASRSNSPPGGIAAELESGVADLKRLLSERTYAGPVDVVAP